MNLFRANLFCPWWYSSLTLSCYIRYAFVEFTAPNMVADALRLKNSILKDRPIQVFRKWTNIPGMRRGSGHRRGGFGRGLYRARHRPTHHYERSLDCYRFHPYWMYLSGNRLLHRSVVRRIGCGLSRCTAWVDSTSLTQKGWFDNCR